MAAASVSSLKEDLESSDSQKEAAYPPDSDEEELLRLVEAPGMEEAVKARVLLLFPEKEKKPDPLRRSNSM